MTEELLKPAEVMRLLNVSRTWLWEASRDGRIPAVRLGSDGPYRYSPSAIEAWLRSAQREGEA